MSSFPRVFERTDFFFRYSLPPLRPSLQGDLCIKIRNPPTYRRSSLNCCSNSSLVGSRLSLCWLSGFGDNKTSFTAPSNSSRWIGSDSMGSGSLDFGRAMLLLLWVHNRESDNFPFTFSKEQSVIEHSHFLIFICNSIINVSFKFTFLQFRDS